MAASYVLRILKGASFSRMSKVIDKVKEKSGKNKVSIFFDMVNCSIRYGAGYYDYLLSEYYNMNGAERKTYMTRVKNKNLIMSLNDQNYSYIFDQKNVFDEKFKDFLGREVLDIAKIDLERFKKFVEGKESFFAKPYIGESGKGIEKLHVADFKSVEELYKYVTNKEKNFGVIEEVIVQHPDAARIYPPSLNCLRIVTLVKDNVPHLVYAVFKTGNNGNVVDNLESGGLAAKFDMEKGEICGQGHMSSMEKYDVHPYTGIPFKGYKLPYLKEIKEMVFKAALVVPEIKYVGWDVCITENGPAIIEGNDYPGYDFPQYYDDGTPRVGLLKRIQEILPDFK
ncbi:MAG: hypothetical protein MSA01_06400 [Anaeromassilibacillus sp.]|nr:hypothetical protein [Anaeromassilibacillus sp.]MDY3779928.1 sugar-transfer associated ATP-grasp domain-containing protein [Candidatus Limousia pullorum]